MFTKKEEGNRIKRKYHEVMCCSVFLIYCSKITILPVHQSSGARAPHGRRKREQKNEKVNILKKEIYFQSV